MVDSLKSALEAVYVQGSVFDSRGQDGSSLSIDALIDDSTIVGSSSRVYPAQVYCKIQK